MRAATLPHRPIYPILSYLRFVYLRFFLYRWPQVMSISWPPHYKSMITNTVHLMQIFCLSKSILMVFSNRTKTVTAFVFLWAARDISCEAPSVREEAEEDKVKSFGAWYTQVGEITWPCHVTGVPTPPFSSNQALNSYAIFQGVGKSHFTKN